MSVYDWIDALSPVIALLASLIAHEIYRHHYARRRAAWWRSAGYRVDE